jgi:hypothetical protein
MSGKIVRLRQVKIVRNATSHSKGRRANDAYRVREHLTEAEMDKLLTALKRNIANSLSRCSEATIPRACEAYSLRQEQFGRCVVVEGHSTPRGVRQ